MLKETLHSNRAWSGTRRTFQFAKLWFRNFVVSPCHFSCRLASLRAAGGVSICLCLDGFQTLQPGCKGFNNDNHDATVCVQKAQRKSHRIGWQAVCPTIWSFSLHFISLGFPRCPFTCLPEGRLKFETSTENPKLEDRKREGKGQRF